MLPRASRGRNEAEKPPQLVDWLAGESGGMIAGLCLQGCRHQSGVSAMQCVFLLAPTHSPATFPSSVSFTSPWPQFCPQLQLLASNLGPYSLCLLPLTMCSPATITKVTFLKKHLQFGSGSSTSVPNPRAGLTPHVTQHSHQALCLSLSSQWLGTS